MSEHTGRELAGLRVLLVHAHPDDESILTGGTLATLGARGAHVVNVTCTLGEEGEVIGEFWAGLAAPEADQLGGYRAAELGRALDALGVVAGPRFLGGAGTWRDSGMEGTPSFEHPRAFARPGADREAEQELQLARIIDEVRPHLVLTYDPVGWYGHPDHIRAHTLTYAAARRAVWPVPRLAWIVVPIGVLEADAAAWAAPQAHGLVPPEPPLRPVSLGELPGWPDEEVTHVVVLDDEARRRRDLALAAHATQLRLHPPLDAGAHAADDANGASPAPTHLALTNNLCQPLARREYYVAFDLDTGAPADGASPSSPATVDDAVVAARSWRRPPLDLDPVTGAPRGGAGGAGDVRGADEGHRTPPPPWDGLVGGGASAGDDAGEERP